MCDPMEMSGARCYFAPMKKSDVACDQCQAGYRRIELVSKPGSKGEFRCLVCDRVLEVFDGATDLAFRLTVQPKKSTRNGNYGDSP
jgi:hypothetical protein